MAISVTRSAGELVLPSEPTPSGILSLSSIDKLQPPGFLVETMHVFKHGQEPAGTIKRALSKALVPYYPMAGRVVISKDGEPEIACTGEGVWFFEASADCTLEEVDWLDGQTPMISMDLLLPRPHDTTSVQLMLQVTQFKCGGFVVCLIVDHIITDGMGAVQIVKAISEFSSNPDLITPKLNPVWCRDAIPPVPRPPPPPSPPQQQEDSSLPTKYHYHSIDISTKQLNHLKTEYLAKYQRHCSTFDVLSATIWQCRTRAIGLSPDDDVQMLFSVDAHRLLADILPAGGDGYYGNCFYTPEVIAPSGTIVNATIVDIVRMIRVAKEKVPVNIRKWLDPESMGDSQGHLPGYRSIVVTDWRQLGFVDVDYGWGKPAFVTPVVSNDSFQICVLINPPQPKEGARVITQFVTEEHFMALKDEMDKFACS